MRRRETEWAALGSRETARSPVRDPRGCVKPLRRGTQALRGLGRDPGCPRAEPDGKSDGYGGNADPSAGALGSQGRGRAGGTGTRSQEKLLFFYGESEPEREKPELHPPHFEAPPLSGAEAPWAARVPGPRRLGLLLGQEADVSCQLHITL